MPKPRPPIVKRSLASWVFEGNLPWQALLLVLIAVFTATRVLPLEMQKRIVNEAIGRREVDLLFAYGATYLAAVVLSNACKYGIQVIETLIAQRTLARMRRALLEHILRLPVGFFRENQPGSVVNAVVNELAVPSNFVGAALSTPVANLLTLLAFAGYLLWLNPLLAVVSLAIYPAAMAVLPFLQRGANRANQKRVDLARTFSGRIAESFQGIHEIHGHAAFRIEQRRFAELIERLRKVRVVWGLFRYGVKSANNFFTSLGPFIVFLLGGWLAIRGELELGALVAFLSAQEKLYDPWKELIEFYQVYQDGKVTYRRTMEFFDVESPVQIDPPDRPPLRLEGKLEVRRLDFVTEAGIRLLQDIQLALRPGEHLALVGFSGSGKSTLALCMAQLHAVEEGRIFLGGHDLTRLSKMDIAANLGLVSQHPFLFEGTLRDNLLYACEALAPAQAGTAAPPTLDDIIAVLHQTGLFADVLQFGLNTPFDPARHEAIAPGLIRVRRKFQEKFGARFGEVVEFYDAAAYLEYSSIAENLLFGSARRPEFEPARLAANDWMVDFLAREALLHRLVNVGIRLARQTVDILGNLPPERVFFAQSPMSAEELPLFRRTLEQLRRRSPEQLSRQETLRLLELALRFTPGTHKMLELGDEFRARLLAARARLRREIEGNVPGAVAFYDPEAVVPSQPILKNILFGNTIAARPRMQEQILQTVIQLLIEKDLLEAIVGIGMETDVGTQGDKLSGGQRQKLAIARVLLKSPRILILDEATSALDNRSQARIQNLLETRWKGRCTVVAVVHRLDIIGHYDRIAVMKAGKIVEIGSFAELMARKGALYELAGKR
ncbi:MAG: ABC transporter ATP-binding protein/permease [Desulfobacterales bacterium]